MRTWKIKPFSLILIRINVYNNQKYTQKYSTAILINKANMHLLKLKFRFLSYFLKEKKIIFIPEHLENRFYIYAHIRLINIT